LKPKKSTTEKQKTYREAVIPKEDWCSFWLVLKTKNYKEGYV
jgi:hypothetical protein